MLRQQATDKAQGVFENPSSTLQAQKVLRTLWIEATTSGELETGAKRILGLLTYRQHPFVDRNYRQETRPLDDALSVPVHAVPQIRLRTRSAHISRVRVLDLG